MPPSPATSARCELGSRRWHSRERDTLRSRPAATSGARAASVSSARIGRVSMPRSALSDALLRVSVRAGAIRRDAARPWPPTGRVMRGVPNQAMNGRARAIALLTAGRASDALRSTSLSLTSVTWMVVQSAGSAATTSLRQPGIVATFSGRTAISSPRLPLAATNLPISPCLSVPPCAVAGWPPRQRSVLTFHNSGNSTTSSMRRR